MIFDVNAWIGSWPFRHLRDNAPATLVARLDRSGIDAAAVSPVEAVFHRNVQPANEALVEAVAPFGNRLVPMATINPTYVKWESDLTRCHEELGMRGVRLFPQYHGYQIDDSLGRKVVAACAERGLPVAVPHRMEDPRERHWLDPGKVVDLSSIANLVAAVPEATVLVLNARRPHLSALWQRDDVREKRWFVDLSLAEAHYVLHRDVRRMRDLAELVDGGGAGHILFGSQVPFSYPGAALVKRAVLGVDQETLDKISYKSALAVFGLDNFGEAKR